MKRDSGPVADDAELRDILSRTTAAAHAVSSARPDHVFEDLALALARILGADAALIAECIDDRRQRMRTHALVLEGRLLPNVEYDVAQTPCRHIVGRESRFERSGVAAEFAPDVMFASLDFDSYAGHSIFGADGAQIGNIVALDRKPIADQELTEALLRIFAMRAGAEMERVRAEAALHASELSYREIFQATEDAIFVHDWETGALLDVNSKACSAYGWTREEMLKLGIADFSSNVPPYTAADALRHMAAARAGQTVRVEWHRRNKDGSLHWDEVFLKPATIGGVPRILAFTREITERKAALEALQQREEQYREIFNASADALVLWNQNLKIVDVNPAFLRIYGFTREQAIGCGYPAHLPPGYVEERLQMIRRALAGEACELQTRAYRANGESFDVELRVIPIRHRGEPHVLAIARDITERRRAEHQLRASEARYRLLFATESDAILLVDADSLRLVDANPAAERMYGYARGELLALTALELSVDPTQTQLAIQQPAGAVNVPLRWHRRRDGSEFPVEINANRLQLDGRTIVVAAIRDITERKRAEEALRASEEQYRAIFNASVDAMVLRDAELKLVDANVAFLARHGVRREDVHGTAGMTFITQQCAPRVEALLHAALAGTSGAVEAQAVAHDGAILDIDVRAVPMQYDGRPHVLSIARDITGRVRVEAALRASEEQYRAIFNASADALVLRDADFGIVDVNDTYERMSGYTRAEVLGVNRVLANPPEARGTIRALHDRALAGEPVIIETQLVRRDGVSCELELRAVPVRHRGAPHVLWMGRDITERKRAEQALRASEEQYRTIFNASADALVLWDSQLRRVDVNRAYEQIYGWTRDEVIDRGYEHRHLPPAYAESRLDMVRRALAGEMSHVEFESLRKNGEPFLAEIHVIPIQYRGEPHVLAIVRDITERRRAEEQRRQLEAQLRQAQKMEAIGQLTGGVAHDFNNILASVMGYLVLAEERASDGGDDKSVHYLGEAQASCRRARDLIQQMLTFSRGGRGEPRAVSLTALVREAMPMLRSMLPSTLAVEVDCSEDVPSVWVDEVQANQVLLNLAINARDAMSGSGTLRIGVAARALAPDTVCTSCRHSFAGQHVELAVADSGAGIEPGMLERIFDPFFTTKEPGKGTGMGLSMVHGIVHEHHGHVLVDSTPGAGTRFRVLWPVHLEAATTPAPSVLRRAPRARLGGRVLLVDDEPGVLEPMRELLTGWGLTVTTASSGVEALAAYRNDPRAFDVVVTDHAMPAMTGIELASQLQALNTSLRWLLCTGFADDATTARAQAQGACTVLRKPVEPSELRSALEACLASAA
ncbi:MAG: PAS domain S-box protein [Gemmatimonadota bacterium]